jgi:hypothetical protein
MLEQEKWIMSKKREIMVGKCVIVTRKKRKRMMINNAKGIHTPLS